MKQQAYLKITAVILSLILSAYSMSLCAHSLPGDWHGKLDTPQGQLMLIFNFSREENGILHGQLEVPTQAPGQKIPLQDIRWQDDLLSFTIPAIAASFQGKANTQGWKGVFKQHMEFPLQLVAGLPVANTVITGMDGHWRSTLHRNGMDLRLLLKIETGEHGTIIRFDSPDASVMNLPVTDFSRDGKLVSFRIAAAAVTFNGVLSDDGESLTGQWLRVGQPELKLSFVRDVVQRQVEHKRPQYPVAPFPYRQFDVQFSNDSAQITLAGTLTLPEGKGPFPAAILLSGSGPQDRDQAVFGHKTFLVIADHLTRQGMAVLRFDDRGTNASTGDHNAATSADFATDANAAVSYLRSRADIQAQSIGFIGHSEGGMIGPLAALNNPDIAFMVLLAAPGTDTVQLIESQRRLIGMSQGISEQQLRETAPIITEINRQVMAAKDSVEAANWLTTFFSAEVMQQLGLTEMQRPLLVNQYSRDWYRFFLSYQPAAVLSQLTMPILAINGSLDHQVAADENLAAIAAALKSNSDVTVIKLEGLNHMFQTSSTGAFAEYAELEETFAPAALNTISDWLTQRFVKPSIRQ